ncbi:protein of unknown function [Acidithiobacillus ferrivorans]|nr:protein of unknown function [Acidithiobacillus ferrivorans]
MALILHWVMRSRLRASYTGLRQNGPLEQPRRIHHHQIRQ